ncbi:MAG: exodeoxyribonuclease VII large subunit [Chloroflexota bacterium]
MDDPRSRPLPGFAELLAEGARRAAGEERGPAAGPRVLGVSEVVRRVRDQLRAAPALREVCVEGEVGSLSVSTAGHLYLTLKDAQAQLPCVLFRDQRLSAPFAPQTGMRILAQGRIDLFEAQGKVQLYIDSIAPAGIGDLAARYEALKQRLAAEGLFAPERKRALPAWPRSIAVVTSPTGAVIHDIRQVLARRWPLVRLLLSPTLVQGPGAPDAIVAAIDRAVTWRDPADGAGVDLVIVARGGGSLEDLWAFNDESVVRAIAASPVPTIVGVGHETDVTLAEFAADRRAATPSVAAELAVPDRAEEAAGLRQLAGRLTAGGAAAIAHRRRVATAERRALDAFRPAQLVAVERERAALLLDRADRATRTRLASAERGLALAAARLAPLGTDAVRDRRAALVAAGRALAALDPDATLARGYAIVRDADGRVLVDASAASAGGTIGVTLARGALDARITAVRDSPA